MPTISYEHGRAREGRSGKSLISSHPLVDVAAYLFLEDIADKQGAGGMNNYLVSLATSLAKSMPNEAYRTWEDFQVSFKAGDSILSAFENVDMPTENCVVTRDCPFLRGWQEYTKRIGEFARIHYDVADYYNATVKPGAVDSQCIICQTYRTEAAARITVDSTPVRYAQIASISGDGRKKVAPEEWKPILLEKAGITDTELNMIMRNNDCVWILYK